jgi:branched-chain amino acid transport system ATP-binding protein
MPDLLQVTGLRAGYGESIVIDGVDFALGDGKSLALLGRNGTGKTTLLTTLVGVTRQRSGRIEFNGRALTGLRPEQRAAAGIGWVPQERNIFRSLTVEENLTAVARRGPWTPERVYGMFPRLAERRAILGTQLSGGEQQMLAIGRALVVNPRLLLLDEPLAGMGQEESERMVELLDHLGREVTLLLVEHDMDAVFRLADRVSVLVAGKVIASGLPEEVRADAEVRQAYLGDAQ